MTDRKREALDYIVENKQIKTVFQPIISLRDGSILGHEALSRITCESEINSNAENYPLMTFTCVLLTNKAQKFKNVLELTEKLAELKKIAKQDSLNIKNSFESL
ncbi:MAG: hypothetical protein VB095_04750 [Anaerovorax sp.]|nr:hypothetical protein [Anaerovorax sp.]